MNADHELRERFEQAGRFVSVDTAASLARVYGTRDRRDRNRRLSALAMAAVIGVIALVIVWRLIPGTGSEPMVGGPTGRIAVVGASGDDRRLSELRLATGDITALYEGPDSSGWADWSPDGTKLAYVLLEPDGSSAIEVANADGSDPVRILDQDDRDETLPGPDILNVSWSPDGTQIAYTGRAVGLGRTVLVMDADGAGEPIALGGTWFWVSWSPDGEHLLLAGFPEPDADGETATDLYTMRPDGSDLVQLTSDVVKEFVPSHWSPDGSQILFAKGDDYNQDVYVMDADGSDVRQLTARDGMDGFPVWSPDGDWIVFTSDRDATAEQQEANLTSQWSGLSIYAMRTDGSEVRMILDGEGGAPLPVAWRTDR